MRGVLVIVACSIAVCAARAAAHPGPHHDIERLTALLEREPGRVGWLLERAQAYRFDGQPAKSLEDLDRAARLGGDVSTIALERGLSLASLHRDKEAEASLSEHLESPRPTATGYAMRAAIRKRGGRNSEAIEDLAAAIALVPKVEWYLTRGRLQESLGRRDQAAECYRDGLARCGGAVAIRMELLRLEIARGRFEAAITLIDEAMRHADIKTDWYLRRADVQAAAGRKDQAHQDRKRALAEAERALAQRPTAMGLLMRAKVFIALDNRDKAATDLRAALRVAPKLGEAKELLRRLEQKVDPKSPGSTAQEP